MYTRLMQNERQQPSTPQTPSSELLNKYFTSIGSTSSPATPIQKRECKTERIKILWNNHLRTKMKFRRVGKKLGTKIAGHDGMSNEILESCSAEFEYFLDNIFNWSKRQCVFSAFLTWAKVIPLNKKSDLSNPEYYRLFSWQSSLFKDYEHLYSNEWSSFATKNFCHHNSLFQRNNVLC